jgi:hypothetical protein
MEPAFDARMPDAPLTGVLYLYCYEGEIYGP